MAERNQRAQRRRGDLLRTQRAGRSHGRGFTLLELLVALALLTVVLSGVYGVFQTTARSLRTVEEDAELTQTARIVLGDLRRDLGSVYPLRVPVTDEQRQQLGDSVPAEGLVSFAGEDAQSPDDPQRDADNVRFTCVVGDANRARGRDDVAEVMYALDTDPDTPEKGLVRKRNDHPGLAVDPQNQLRVEQLTPLATSLNIRYWAGDQSTTGTTSTATASTSADGSSNGPTVDDDGWARSWSDPNLLPPAVEITLGLTPDRKGGIERKYRMVVTLPIRTPRPDPAAANRRTTTTTTTNLSTGGSTTTPQEETPGLPLPGVPEVPGASP